MNDDHKATWVAALRSGNYQQTQGVLRGQAPGGPDEHGYCCLGVAAEVCLRGDVQSWAVDGDQLLGAEALELLGLDATTQLRLADMNDQGKPFTYIADFIEQEL